MIDYQRSELKKAKVIHLNVTSTTLTTPQLTLFSIIETITKLINLQTFQNRCLFFSFLFLKKVKKEMQISYFTYCLEIVHHGLEGGQGFCDD